MERSQRLYGTIPAQANAIFVAIDERDGQTYQHGNRVAGLSTELGRACRLSEKELKLLLVAAGLHDVGKIGIPDTILKKPTALDDSEWAIMKEHCVKSERIVRAAQLGDGAAIALAARHHHERFDGQGYPDGLAAESIPFLARIIAVADTYDAMAELRTYGPARSHREIMTELHSHQGRQHDPYLVAKFATIIERSEFKTDN